jgi:four helix bundle protein
MFTHHKLKVYEKALAIAAGGEALSAGWGRRQAIVDHFRRASESIVLDVYQVGLDFMRWFVGLPGGGDLSDRLCREIDKSATSVVLNVAEGHGRYSQLDHRRFLEIAAASAVKAAAYLDLYQQKAPPARLETSPGRELLSRIAAMLSIVLLRSGAWVYPIPCDPRALR